MKVTVILPEINQGQEHERRVFANKGFLGQWMLELGHTTYSVIVLTLEGLVPQQ